VGEAKFVAVELAARLTNNTGRELGQHYGGRKHNPSQDSHR
jgi:hypothetical protein